MRHHNKIKIAIATITSAARRAYPICLPQQGHEFDTTLQLASSLRLGLMVLLAGSL